MPWIGSLFPFMNQGNIAFKNGLKNAACLFRSIEGYEKGDLVIGRLYEAIKNVCQSPVSNAIPKQRRRERRGGAGMDIFESMADGASKPTPTFVFLSAHLGSAA
ncbi:hypothetical protein F2P79_023848 [Pimephales promelas]|nr:hypothetical protein F2P79_023848 [Pimephales promelas]